MSLAKDISEILRGVISSFVSSLVPEAPEVLLVILDQLLLFAEADEGALVLPLAGLQGVVV